MNLRTAPIPSSNRTIPSPANMTKKIDRARLFVVPQDDGKLRDARGRCVGDTTVVTIALVPYLRDGIACVSGVLQASHYLKDADAADSNAFNTWTAVVSDSWSGLGRGPSYWKHDLSLVKRLGRDMTKLLGDSVYLQLMSKVGAIQKTHGRVLITVTSSDPDLFDASLSGCPLGATATLRGCPLVEKQVDVATRIAKGEVLKIYQRKAELRELEESFMEPLFVATDASKDRYSQKAAIGWVSAEGMHGTQQTNGVSIAEAEMLAMHEALTELDRNSRVPRGRRIVLLSDSKHAIEMVFGKRKLSTSHLSSTRKLAELRKLVAGPRIHVEWVRGHNGHPLNELADDLARHRNRCTGMFALDEDLIREQEQKLVEDALAEGLTNAQFLPVSSVGVSGEARLAG
ncbi:MULTISPECIES: ribonuclease HI [unclassified Corynebacterium]|uniref:ribonuclease HI n=1 Tax=unclassified Corynebacterium TaxID=2624378 RepID=UPI0030AF5FF0